MILPIRNISLFLSLTAAWMLPTTLLANDSIKKDDSIKVDTIEWYHSISIPRVTISSPRFESTEERYEYLRFKRRVRKMKRLADDILAMEQVINNTLASMDSPKQRKQYQKRMEKELKAKYKKTLKNHYRSEGFVLIKILERSWGTSMYQKLYDLKGKTKADLWQGFAKLYGYDLMEGYKKEDHPWLEEILSNM